MPFSMDAKKFGALLSAAALSVAMLWATVQPSVAGPFNIFPEK